MVRYGVVGPGGRAWGRGSWRTIGVVEGVRAGSMRAMTAKELEKTAVTSAAALRIPKNFSPNLPVGSLPVAAC